MANYFNVGKSIQNCGWYKQCTTDKGASSGRLAHTWSIIQAVGLFRVQIKVNLYTFFFFFYNNHLLGPCQGGLPLFVQFTIITKSESERISHILGCHPLCHTLLEWKPSNGDTRSGDNLGFPPFLSLSFLAMGQQKKGNLPKGTQMANN